MRTLILTLLASATLLSTVPLASANVSEFVIEDVGDFPWCVDTGATCGPYGDAWVSAEATGPGVRVCVTTNTGHILC